MVRRRSARHGRLGRASYGAVWPGSAGEARRSKASSGEAGIGKAGILKLLRGGVRQAWRVVAQLDVERPVRQGDVWRGGAS